MKKKDKKHLSDSSCTSVALLATLLHQTGNLWEFWRTNFFFFFLLSFFPSLAIFAYLRQPGRVLCSSFLFFSFFSFLKKLCITKRKSGTKCHLEQSYSESNLEYLHRTSPGCDEMSERQSLAGRQRCRVDLQYQYIQRETVQYF